MAEERIADAQRHSEDNGRRDFLKSSLLTGAAAVTAAAVTTPPAQAQPGIVAGTRNHYYVPATDKTVHWGYFSKLLKPLVEVSSGDFVTIEALTHHANDDAERMVKGDPGAESVFYWDKQRKGVVPGALLSAGDSHAAQGDSELCGTAIECSLTGTFQLILHKQAALAGALSGLQYPLLETQMEWVLHGFSYPKYLSDLGANAQSDIYSKSSVDLALRDAFRKMRHFLMTTRGLSEDEAISLMSVAVDFGVTQVVDGNWGVHAILKKSLSAGEA